MTHLARVAPALPTGPYRAADFVLANALVEACTAALMAAARLSVEQNSVCRDMDMREIRDAADRIASAVGTHAGAQGGGS